MAVDMFLKLMVDGNAVPGESIDDKHKEEIEVLSWSWNMSQAGAGHSATGGGSGKVNITDLVITKYIDRSTPTLIKMCCQGKHVGEAHLTVRKAGGGGIEYVKLAMEDCMVSSLTSGQQIPGDRLTEVLSLNFARFKYEYTPQEA